MSTPNETPYEALNYRQVDELYNQRLEQGFRPRAIGPLPLEQIIQVTQPEQAEIAQIDAVVGPDQIRYSQVYQRLIGTLQRFHGPENVDAVPLPSLFTSMVDPDLPEQAYRVIMVRDPQDPEES